jgi:Ca2+-binding EF-hand superfamily protein
MMRHLRTAGMMGMLVFATMSALPAAAQGTFPSAAQEFSSHFWTERMMRAMDANRDGMVSRQEFLTYMGAQYDMMDTGKKGMLTSQQFTDKKMMARTFNFPVSVSETGPR